MSIFGKLEDLPLPQLLQVVAANRLTGKLTVTRRQGQGVVLLRNGRIVYAATNSARETVGNLLLMKRLITASALAEGLELQGRSKTDRRLGSILVELGAVEQSDVEEVMREQVGRVLREMLAWKTGFVRFRAASIPDGGEIEVDASDFFLQEGLEPSKIVFDVMTGMVADAEEKEVTSAAASSTDEQPASESEGADAVISLRDVSDESYAPALTGEATLEILATAERFFDRGVLFTQSTGELRGIGQFGLSSPQANEKMRALRIPNDEASVFLEALELRETYRGPLEGRYWNNVLERSLGDRHPDEVAVLPVMVAERVVLLLYGDNARSQRPLPPLGELERLLEAAGLKMERALYDRKKGALERRQDRQA